MKTELVNTLLKAGIVTDAEVERALGYESGSSLVERLLSLGAGSEGDVFKVILNKLQLEVIYVKDIENVAQKALDLLPKELIERHHVLPFYTDDTNVYIAMVDPTNDACINEVNFFTGLRVVPYGMTASELTKALNKYYSLGLSESFRHGQDNLVKDYSGPTPPQLSQNVASPSAPVPPPPIVASPSVPVPPIPQAEPTKKIPKIPPAPGIVLPPTPGEQIEQDLRKQAKIKEMQENFDKLSEIVAEKEPIKIEVAPIPEPKVEPKPEPPTPTAAVAPPVAGAEPKPVYTTENMTLTVDYDEEAPEFKDIVSDISSQTTGSTSPDDVDTKLIEQASNKGAVLTAVLKEVRKLSSRCLVLFVKYDDLIGVLGTGVGIEGKVEGFKISTKEPSPFKTVFDTKKEYYGPLTQDPALENFIKYFGNERPQSVTIVPSVIEDEVFAVIYTEEAPVVSEVKKVADAMADAFVRLLNQ